MRQLPASYSRRRIQTWKQYQDNPEQQEKDPNY